MCGIAGELRFHGTPGNRRTLERMTEAQVCRGPDGEGFWEDGWVSLAHRRLSVIDLSDASSQPMVDDRGEIAVVFNGCIYNYPQLREELGSDGPFHSSGDTEVVMRAYMRWGEEFVEHLVGMFAIAIADLRRDVVLLVRDRLGIKPLYVSRGPHTVRFASALPALLAAGDVDTSLDPAALHHYFTWHSIVPAPRTVLRGIQKIPAATIRVIRADGRCTDRIYWQPTYARDADRADWDEQDWQDAIEEALTTAVSRRLIADVPVGVLLSGGLDSSLLVALAAHKGAHPPRTYSIGFASIGGRSGDEFRYSDAVARAFGTDHQRITVSSEEVAPAVQASIAAMTEPMSSHDVAAFYLLAQAVSRELKVVLCGQGADEVFAGYAYHASAAGADREEALDVLTGSFFDRPHDALETIAIEGAIADRDVSRATVERQLSAPGAETALDAVLRLDTHLLMVDDPVKRVDNMMMAWSVEARVPFLDQDVVSLAAACPPELKLAQGGKGILKALARRTLPAEVIDRPKGYFPVPALQRLEGSTLQMVQDALQPASARVRRILKHEAIDRLLADPNWQLTRTGNTLLWPVAVLELWLAHHGID
jgi:asparagine synthase (glutamine-hydrolysing)